MLRIALLTVLIRVMEKEILMQLGLVLVRIPYQMASKLPLMLCLKRIAMKLKECVTRAHI